MSRSTRWCPTPEQLMILEELYRGGLRTPKAFQIQKITVHLSLYGKIEGKNVFYWFQNHKARDRQKLRRKLMSNQLEHQQHQKLQNPLHHHIDSYSSSALHQPPYFNSAPYIHQGRVEDAVPRAMDYTWKMSIIPRSIHGHGHGHDWMMMMTTTKMDASLAIPNCTNSNRPPLETLNLFPTTSTSLKEQCKLN